jgi:catechol 2,3-dioxygenase-like lactoylglutathione lyase family enzyme
MLTEIRHFAILVPDLQEAETYYQQLFDMKLIGRESLLPDGNWYSLPLDKSWEDAAQAGFAVGMLALQRGALTLALFPGDPQPGQLYIVGLNMPVEEIRAVRGRLALDTEIWQDEPEALTFRDRYQIVWQIYPLGTEFQTSGHSQGRWLQV